MLSILVAIIWFRINVFYEADRKTETREMQKIWRDLTKLVYDIPVNIHPRITEP